MCLAAMCDVGPAHYFLTDLISVKIMKLPVVNFSSVFSYFPPRRSKYGQLTLLPNTLNL
jgi:hypothetical protein